MVEVPVNTAYKGSFLAHVLNDSAASTLVVDESYVERIARIAGDLTALRTLVVRGDTAAADGLDLRVVAFDELTAADPAPVTPIDAGELTVTVMLGAMAELLQQAAPAADDADNPLELP